MPIIQEEVIVRRVPSKEYMLVRRILYFVLDLIEISLAVRFLLRLLGANSGSQFVQFVYEVTHPFMVPFLGIFPSLQVSRGIIDWSTLLAMTVYAVLAYLILRAFRLIFRES